LRKLPRDGKRCPGTQLSTFIDLAEAYEWGWAELGRIEAETATEADKMAGD
jgi:hypothetical protein